MDPGLELNLNVEIEVESQPQLLVIASIAIFAFLFLATLLATEEATKGFLWLLQCAARSVADEILCSVCDSRYCVGGSVDCFSSFINAA